MIEGEGGTRKDNREFEKKLEDMKCERGKEKGRRGGNGG